MKLLIVTQTLDRNDPILGFFHQWVVAFAGKFETVTVIALNIGSHSLPKNVSVHTLGKELGMERLPRILRYISLLIRLRKEYTHVFAHMNPEYVIGGGWFWQLMGKKIGFWYVHGAVSVRLKLAAFFAHAVFTASHESCRLNSSKVRVVGHGIDTDLFALKRSIDTPALVSTGRISPSKNLETVIDTYTRVRTSLPNATLVIAGGAGSSEAAAYTEEIKKRAQQSGASVLPPIPHHDIPALLSTSRVFLSASGTGSLDKAVLEAMSAGVVPVTSNIAFRNILEPLGLFVPQDATAFGLRVLELLKNDTEYRRLSQAVREIIIRDHSLPHLIEKLKSAYSTL